MTVEELNDVGRYWWRRALVCEMERRRLPNWAWVRRRRVRKQGEAAIANMWASQ